MRVVVTAEQLRQVRREFNGSVGLVPTMGALHAGHLALVAAARDENDVVVASIFVNPTQFAPTEDLSTYPRDLQRDLALLIDAGCDLVFTPTPEVLYPSGFQTYVTVETLSQGLEGARRPGHFRGVATVVAKLFNLIQPHFAYFGQKDAQQVVVIRQMVRDLNLPLEVVVLPTVREADGLALSSRNAYLAGEQRPAAAVLSRALGAAGAAYAAGERHPGVLREQMLALLGAEPLAEAEYVSIADARTLVEQEAPSDNPLLASMAVRVGRTRLIDNLLLPLALNTRAGLGSVLGAAPSGA